MIDWKTLCVLGALTVAMPATAHAAAAGEAARSSAPLATVTADDSVEIRVQGVTPAGDAVEWKWGKLVVPIADKPEAGFAESYNDETVKRVALVGGEKPRLIVMFRHGAKTAKILTDASTVTNTGDGFRVTIPRKHALAEKAAEVEAEPEPAPAPEPADTAEREPDPSAAAEAEPETDAPAAAAGVTEEASAEAEPLNFPEGESEPIAAMPTPNPSMFGTIGFTLVLLAVGGGFVWWKRRAGTNTGTPRGFTVIGNQVLGPKSRIVLMGLGDRRMLLAVSEAGTTVVDKWTEGDDHTPSTSARAPGAFDEQTLAAIEFGEPIEAPRSRRETQRAATIRAYQPPTPDDHIDDENAESTAVRGLLALRQQMEHAEHPDLDDEEDDAWSRALQARMRSA